MLKHYCDFNEGCAFVGLHYNKRNCKLQIIPVIVSINICTKVWCVCVRTLPNGCYICVIATDSCETAMGTHLKPIYSYVNCSWSEQFFVKYIQFNNVPLFSVLIFIYSSGNLEFNNI
jgi:hypothetical protein